MAENIIRTRFQVRRDTEANFNHTILAQGEPGYTTDTHVFKIGDGEHTWENLNAISLSFIGETTTTTDSTTGITAFITQVTFNMSKTSIEDLNVTGVSIDTIPDYVYDSTSESLTLGSKQETHTLDLTATGSYEKLTAIDAPSITIVDKGHHHSVTPKGTIK